MYFEIFRNGNLIKTGNEVIDNFAIHNELMYLPATRIKLPVTYREFLSGREEFLLHFSDKCLHAIVTGVKIDKENEVMEIELTHVLHEWEYRQISVNNAIKDKNLNVVYKGGQTATNGNVSVSASPFSMLISEVGTFSDENYIQRSGASAWTANGDKQTVTVNHSKVESEAGEYDVTFSSGGASVTVKASVKESEKKSEKDGYVMTANSFSMTVDDVASMTDADYIKKAGAKVKPSLPISVDSSKVNPKNGTYTVKFTSEYEEGGVEKEISVSVTALVVGSSGQGTFIDEIADIFNDDNFAYSGWEIDYSAKARREVIDYVYSRQSKLSALNKTMELTEDIFWRVGLVAGRKLEIGEFGEKKQMRISHAVSGVNNRRIIEEPTIEHQFDHVINMASVYSSKSDGGMNSMTLREVYMNPQYQNDNFPVIILRSDVNNERDYRKYTQFPELAPNNEYEFAIIDLESVALEGGQLIEGTYACDDIAPFNIDPNEKRQITNGDRLKASRKLYAWGERKLRQARRRFKIVLTCEELPWWVNVGDRILLDYDNAIFIDGECTSYMKKVLSLHAWFYLTQYDCYVNEGESVFYRVVLEKYLNIEREIRNE